MPTKKSVIDVNILYAKELSRIVKQLNTNVAKSITMANTYVQRFFIKYEEPYAEITHDGKALHAKISLPGAYKKNVLVRIVNTKLEIEAVRKVKNDTTTTKRGYYRAIDLPPTIDKKRIKARFTNHTLTIRIPLQLLPT